MVAKGQEGAGERRTGVWISRCKLVYIGWINNSVPLYSTRGYIQYSVTNHSGKNMKKNIYIHTYMYVITESLCCAAEISTAL